MAGLDDVINHAKQCAWGNENNAEWTQNGRQNEFIRIFADFHNLCWTANQRLNNADEKEKKSLSHEKCATFDRRMSEKKAPTHIQFIKMRVKNGSEQ